MATYGGVRGLAQAFLRSAAESGLSVNEAIRQLRASELGTYRRADMLADYRQFMGIEKKADVLKYIREDYKPSRSMYTQTKGYQRAPFRYQVNMSVYKPLTGETVIVPTNISSDVQLTKRQIEESGIDAVSPALDKSEFEITGYNLYAATYTEEAIWE